jgi:iron(III) transport system permease protein
MNAWRLSVAIFLLVAVAVPALLPFIELASRPEGWQLWAELGRLYSLAWNTVFLAGGTLAVTLPLGIVCAVLLYRSDLPLARWLTFLVLLSLFVPLPLITTAWQAALGTTGWLPVAWWASPAPEDPDVSPQGVLIKPWAYGYGPAIWVQSIASLPWVVLLVGHALGWVERELEEDMLTVVGPCRVLWSVTLPRARVAIGAAALWIVLQCVTEITITDMMQVRTFAEEVYGQIVAGDDAALAHAVATAVPSTIVIAALIVWTSSRWERSLPALTTRSAPLCLICFGRGRWLVFAVVALAFLLIAGVPLGSLVWKAGLAGSPSTWSLEVMWTHLGKVLASRGAMVLKSIGWALATGAATTAAALIICWLAQDTRWFHVFALGILAITWAVAGPIVGLGLNDMIAKVVLRVTDSDWLAAALWYGPSPLPALWAQFIRLLPFALALLWPVVRMIPAEVREAARVDGARPGQELCRVVLPLTLRSCQWTALAVAILTLGEVSAGKIVATPGSQTFGHEVFSQMHYGVSNDLAAMCLLLTAIVAGGGSVALVWARSDRSQDIF